MAKNTRWDERKKIKKNKRLVWYIPQVNNYWTTYWKQQDIEQYLLNAKAHKIENDIIGKTLIKYLKKSGKHIEAGCGPGYWVAALTSAGYDVEGIELESEVVKMARLVVPSLPIKVGDALNIDAPDNYYDSYISFGVIEHLPEGPDPFLQEAYRVLKKNGVAIIMVPAFGPLRRIKAALNLFKKPKPSDRFYQYGFTIKEFKSIMEHHGFKILEWHYQGLHRLLMEECKIYRKLMNVRGGGILKKLFNALFSHFDGHMLIVVGEKHG